MTAPVPFDNSYARLPDRFFARVQPARPSDPALIRVNRNLAAELGLDADWLAGPDGLDLLSGRAVSAGADPLAAAYAGHQFGNFVPQLGDGRAILLGEVLDRSGRRRDIQLKGAGLTPFSRQGDGKAALGPVLREYVVSEAMAALGIATTRSLAAVMTGDPVYRERPLPGAVLTRVASSHIRVGTFEFFAARGDDDGVRALADHVIARHYPDAAEAARPYRALLDSVITAQARLIADWLLVGFIHGVMNTDNMSVAGETIDYGPCAFMDAFDPATVFSSIDRNGRYAYANQPQIGLWNLTRFAETLLLLLDADENAAIADAQDALSHFAPQFDEHHRAGMMRKLGIVDPAAEDSRLAATILAALKDNEVDYTLFFRRLTDAVEPGAGDDRVAALFRDSAIGAATLALWRGRIARQARAPGKIRTAMQAVNPAFIPRNHRIEAMIAAAVDRQDFGPFDELMSVLAKPYDDQPQFAHYADPPREDERVLATFCGT